ncbi:Uncharacterized protein SCF082_LOCUS1827 [Durusdinium trenchii]|uniref:CBM20 domain-containing protein n=1 Tax=Durusdinium trenchii TaxID=1381693 RepID=A0ABP0HHP9_9DINO
MPVELAFQCSCSSARPGDQLRVVGEGSSLGDWDPHRSTAVLQAGEFPLWQITLPVLVTSTKSCWSLEYKYVILREDGSVEWEEFDRTWEASEDPRLEDLGFDEVPSTEASSLTEEEVSGSRARNRRLEIEGDCVVFCSETFNHLASTFKAVWPISTDWGPEVAGGSATIGSGKHRNSQNPLFKLQYQLPRQLFGTAHRRGRLVSVLCKLGDRIPLAPGLWTQIMGYVG